MPWQQLCKQTFSILKSLNILAIIKMLKTFPLKIHTPQMAFEQMFFQTKGSERHDVVILASCCIDVYIH
jgi:hypothetical protein